MDMIFALNSFPDAGVTLGMVLLHEAATSDMEVGKRKSMSELGPPCCLQPFSKRYPWNVLNQKQFSKLNMECCVILGCVCVEGMCEQVFEQIFFGDTYKMVFIAVEQH